MLSPSLAAALLLLATLALAAPLHADPCTAALRLRGLDDAAIAELSARADASPDDQARAAAWIGLADIYESQPGGEEATAVALVHALELLPAAAEGRDLLHYRLGRALESRGDTVRAAYEYETILTDYPDSPHYRPAGQAIARCFELNQPRIAATVGERIITIEELDRVVARLDGVAQDELARKPERRRLLLEQMVEEKLVAAYARGAGLHLEGEVRWELERNVDRFLAQHALKRRVKAPIEVTEADIQVYYNANLDTEFYVEARVRGFVFICDSKEEAAALHERLEKEGFSEVRNGLWQEMQDRGGGDSGLHPMSEYPEDLAKALEGKQVGQTIDARKTDRGWELFHIQVFNPGTHTEFERAQRRIEQTLRNQAERVIYTALIDSMKSVIPVKIEDTP